MRKKFESFKVRKTNSVTNIDPQWTKLANCVHITALGVLDLSQVDLTSFLARAASLFLSERQSLVPCHIKKVLSGLCVTVLQNV